MRKWCGPRQAAAGMARVETVVATAAQRSPLAVDPLLRRASVSRVAVIAVTSRPQPAVDAWPDQQLLFAVREDIHPGHFSEQRAEGLVANRQKLDWKAPNEKVTLQQPVP